jgi:hypothetical protein
MNGLPMPPRVALTPLPSAAAAALHAKRVTPFYPAKAKKIAAARALITAKAFKPTLTPYVPMRIGTTLSMEFSLGDQVELAFDPKTGRYHYWHHVDYSKEE